MLLAPGSAGTVTGSKQNPVLAGLLAPMLCTTPCPLPPFKYPASPPALCSSTSDLFRSVGLSAKQRSLVLYSLSSLLLSYEKWEAFQPSSSLPPSGKQIFPAMASVMLSRLACVIADQALCSPSTCTHPRPPSGPQTPEQHRVIGPFLPFSSSLA